VPNLIDYKIYNHISYWLLKLKYPSLKPYQISVNQNFRNLQPNLRLSSITSKKLRSQPNVWIAYLNFKPHQPKRKLAIQLIYKNGQICQYFSKLLPKPNLCRYLEFSAHRSFFPRQPLHTLWLTEAISSMYAKIMYPDYTTNFASHLPHQCEAARYDQPEQKVGRPLEPSNIFRWFKIKGMSFWRSILIFFPHFNCLVSFTSNKPRTS
jgi:hypothetical protein